VDIVGRDAEHGRLLDFIDRAPAGPAALVIEGEPGIGKTLLWLAAVDGARARDAVVLETRPSESETSLSFLGLNDLLDAVDPAAIASLAPPQRRAIEIALRRVDPRESSADEAAVAVGVLNILRRLAGERRVVIAIDDEPWLDLPSVAVLASAVRRLRDEDVRLVLTRRTESPASRLVSAIRDDRIERIDLEPLAIGALHRLVRTRLGLSLPRPALVRLHAVTRGNPLYALELARLFGTGAVAPGALDRGVPANLQGLLERRLADLAESSRRAVLTAAIASRPTLALIAKVLEADEDDVATDLDGAQRAGILVRRGDRIEFTHPLLAAAARGSLSGGERRRLHRVLARLVDDPEEVAFHLAESSDTPDEAVASALEAAGRRAVDRGAVIAGIDLHERAVDRTPAGDPRARARRTVQLAATLFTSGDTARAHRLLSDVLPTVDEPNVRSEAALLLATIIWFDGDSRDAAAIAETALAETVDDGWRAKFHSRLSWIYDFDVARATEHAREALELLDPERDPDVYAFALLSAAHGDLQLGIRADHDAVARGHALQEGARLWEFSTLPANWAKWMDDFSRARELTQLYLDRARTNGDDSSVAQLLGYLAELECWTGHLDLGLAYVEEALVTAEQTEQPAFVAAALARRASIAALRGRTADALADAAASLAVAEEQRSPPLIALARGTLATIAFVVDDFAAVDRESRLASEELERVGDVTQPSHRFHADQIEALISLGELDRAEALTARLAARGALGPVRWALATAARCRALLAAARGDVRGALDEVEAALSVHQELDMPVELGRTLLVAGQLRRRAGRRRDAATALGEARDIFERVGATPWIDRVRREADRLGLQRGDGLTLTPSEERIARLAASGLTNREVASRLSISPKTVEANLARTYEKLAIHSRAELGTVVARLAADDAAPGGDAAGPATNGGSVPRRT
jgi:DNA-binding CsgD family transcriptional regulator